MKNARFFVLLALAMLVAIGSSSAVAQPVSDFSDSVTILINGVPTQTQTLTQDQEKAGIGIAGTIPQQVFDFIKPGQTTVSDRLTINQATFTFISDPPGGSLQPAPGAITIGEALLGTLVVPRWSVRVQSDPNPPTPNPLPDGASDTVDILVDGKVVQSLTLTEAQEVAGAALTGFIPGAIFDFLEIGDLISDRLTLAPIPFSLLSDLDVPGGLGPPLAGATIIGGESATVSPNWALLVVSDVPEPSTIALFGIGALGLLGHAWQRRKRAA